MTRFLWLSLIAAIGVSLLWWPAEKNHDVIFDLINQEKIWQTQYLGFDLVETVDQGLLHIQSLLTHSPIPSGTESTLRHPVGMVDHDDIMFSHIAVDSAVMLFEELSPDIRIHEQAVFFTIVPAAKSGITAGIILGIGRAIGETMAVIMVAGNQARLPAGLLKGVRTLTANIVIEMGYATGLHREALIATGVVLFVFILIINLSVALLKRGADHE